MFFVLSVLQAAARNICQLVCGGGSLSGAADMCSKGSFLRREESRGLCDCHAWLGQDMRACVSGLLSDWPEVLLVIAVMRFCNLNRFKSQFQRAHIN